MREKFSFGEKEMPKGKSFLQEIREKAGQYGRTAMLILALEFFAQKGLTTEQKEQKKIEFVKKLEKQAKTKEGFAVIYLAGKIGNNEAVAISVEDPGDPKVKGDELVCEGKFIKIKQNDKEIIRGETDCQGFLHRNPLGETVYTPEIRSGQTPIANIELAKQTMQSRRNQLYVDCMVLKGFNAVEEKEKSDFAQWLDKKVKENKKQIQEDFGKTAIDDEAFEEFIK